MTPKATQEELQAASYAALRAHPTSEQAKALVAKLSSMVEEHTIRAGSRQRKRRGTASKLEYATGAFLADLLRLKGKSSIWIAQNVERKMRNFLGHKFWARGYFVTTVGRDEEVIRAYIRNQELADRQLEQFELKISAAPKSNQSS